MLVTSDKLSLSTTIRFSFNFKGTTSDWEIVWLCLFSFFLPLMHVVKSWGIHKDLIQHQASNLQKLNFSIWPHILGNWPFKKQHSDHSNEENSTDFLLLMLKSIINVKINLIKIVQSFKLTCSVKKTSVTRNFSILPPKDNKHFSTAVTQFWFMKITLTRLSPQTSQTKYVHRSINMCNNKAF